MSKLPTFLAALAALIATLTPGSAQGSLTENTFDLDEAAVPYPATLKDVAWLTGRWLGEGFGGTLEETWSPPLGGAMVATFRLVKDGKPAFYEMCWIREKNGTLEYNVKHFHPDLVGWEAKGEHVTFPLVKIDEQGAHFRGLTLAADGNSCTHYLALGQEDGSHKEMALRYQRAEGLPVMQRAAQREGNLDGLRPLLGAWCSPDKPHQVVHDYRSTVGGHSLHLREGFAVDSKVAAELDGLVFWSPDRGKIEFVAVAGKGPGQGRLLRGVYRVLEGGAIERTYSVHYRNLADTPGEGLGGLDRTFREVYTIEGNKLEATLEWWRDGHWQTFGPGEYSLVRRK